MKRITTLPRMHGKTEARAMNITLVADDIVRQHDELRETCSASTHFFDYKGVVHDRLDDGCIALSTRESYSIEDVIAMLVQTSQPAAHG